MRNLKKVLSLALVFVMVFALMVSASAAYSDQDQIENKEAVELLAALKIMTGRNGAFDPTAPVQRGELAKMLYIGSTGSDDGAVLYAGSPNPFQDVPNSVSEYWGVNYVKWAYNKGIISGKSPTMFYPKDNVTGVEALKMALTALGYDSKVEGYQDNANWQYNIVTRAQEVGLLKNISYDVVNRAMTRDEAAQMVVNMLNTNTVTYISFGDKPILVPGSVTMLKRVFDVDTVKGDLMATSQFGLGGVTAQTSDKKDQIKVDDNDGETDDLYIGTADSALVGQEVMVYFEAETKVVYGVFPTGKNVTTVVTNGVVPSGDKITVTLTKDNVYVDGKQVDTSGDYTTAGSDLEKAGYKVTYIGTKADNGDITYTKALISTTTLGQVTAYDSVKAKTLTVSDFAGTPAAITDLNGAKIADVTGADAVAKDDIVLVTKVLKEGTTYNYTLAKAESISGQITMIRGGKYTIGGTAYAASEIVNADDVSAYTINANGTFYLDAYGNIAKVVAPSAVKTDNYALIYDAAAYDSGSSDLLGDSTAEKPARVYALLQDGSLGAYEIESITYTSGTDVTKTNKEVDASVISTALGTPAKATPVLVPYTLTSDGKIVIGKKIDLSQNDDTKTEAYAKGASILTIGADNYAVDANTVVFAKGDTAPTAAVANAYTAYIGKGNIPALAKDSVVKASGYKATAYGKTLTYLVVEPKDAGLSGVYGVVTDIVSKANADGKAATFVTLFTGSTNEEFECKDGNVVGEIKVGTAVSYEIKSGKLDSMTDLSTDGAVKKYVAAYEEGKFLTYAAAAADVNTGEGATYAEISDKVMLITMTKGADDSYTGAAGVSAADLVTSAADIKNADADTENVTLHTNAGKVDLIILWK